MFREIREVKGENLNNKKKENENYKKIKPETGITFEEAMNFWEMEFERIRNEAQES